MNASISATHIPHRRGGTNANHPLPPIRTTVLPASRNLLWWTGCAVAFAIVLGIPPNLSAQPITVPNGSFELRPAGAPFYVDTRVDSWQKAAQPAWYNPADFGGYNWDQLAGVFLDSNPYSNRDGLQAGYMLSIPQVALFQDYNTLDWDDPAPTHDFNTLFQVGKSYKLTIGLFGKSMADGSLLSLSLYYRDAGNNIVPVGTTLVTYTAAGFPTSPPLSLFDYEVNVPTVLSGDAWAGKNIGIKIESLSAGGGYWDMDNVRLTAIPEPSVFSLATLMLGGWRFLHRRTRQPK